MTDDARITDASYESNWPELVWTGTEVGLTWEDDRFSPSTPQVFFQRIGFCD